MVRRIGYGFLHSASLCKEPTDWRAECGKTAVRSLRERGPEPKAGLPIPISFHELKNDASNRRFAARPAKSVTLLGEGFLKFGSWVTRTSTNLLNQARA